MAKITLTDLTSLANDTSATDSINTNFQLIEDYINNNVLSRDTGVETNTMQNDMDMNSNNLLNVGTVNGYTVQEMAARYLGAFAEPPTTDNLGNALVTGALYYDTFAQNVYVWDGSQWKVTFIDNGDYVLLNANNTWQASQAGSSYVATVNGNVTLNFGRYQNFILTLDGNLTLDNPTTELVGQTGVIVLKQDATGSRTVTLGSQFLTSSAGFGISTSANFIDLVPYVVSGDGEILLGAPQVNFS